MVLIYEFIVKQLTKHSLIQKYFFFLNCYNKFENLVYSTKRSRKIIKKWKHIRYESLKLIHTDREADRQPNKL